MDDACSVRGIQRVRDLGPDIEQRVKGERPGGELVLQRPPSRYSIVMNDRPSCSPMS